MAKTKDSLQTLPPEPIDERSPLLNNSNGQPSDQDVLEAQAEQERREHDATTVPLAEEPSTRQLLATMSGLWMCTFLAALGNHRPRHYQDASDTNRIADSTVVATLSGPITSSFSSGTSFSWIASGYLIANSACQPLSGRLTDIFGRRAGLIFAFTFFAAGTLMCGLAPQAGVMIAGRIIAGAGGGCLNTVAVFVASDLIPLRKRGVWQGLGNIVFGTGVGLGGIFGGFINDRLNWRYAFYIQVPLILVAGTFAAYRVDIPVKDTDTGKLQRVDFLGAFTLVAALVLLLVGLNSGGNIVPWNHPLVYVSLPLSFVFLIGFIFVEEKIATEPIVPVRLLLNRSVLSALLVNWFETMAVYALLYYGPMFFQVVRGVTPTQSGTLFVPHAAGAALGSLGSGIFMRWTGKYWWLHVFAQAVSLASAACILIFFDRNISFIPPFFFLLFNGLAYGVMLTVTLIALISAVDHKYQAIITAASYAFRSTGSVIGITIASAVFQNILKLLLYRKFGDRPDAAEQIRRIRESPDVIGNLPNDWREGVLDAYVGALKGVWTAIVGFAVLAAVVSLFIRQHTLYSNLERR